MDRCAVAVSVIVPVFNSEKYLRECMDSIVTQEFSSFEVICIDDCSTDNSRDILHDYEKRYACVHVFLNEANRGIAYTRNRGLDLAKGKYIQFVDSDDMLKPSAIAQLYQSAERCSAQIIFYDFEVMDELLETPTIRGIDSSFMKVGKIYTGMELFCLEVKRNNHPGAVWRAFWDKEFIDKNQCKFSEKLVVGEDILFTFQVSMKANRVFVLPSVLYIHRRRAESLTTKPATTAPYSLICCVIELWLYWRDYPDNHEYNTAMQVYLTSLYSGFYEFIEKNIGISEKGSLNNPADVFMLKLLKEHSFRRYDYIKFNKEKINEVKRANRVFVFGAGVYGRETVYALLKENVIPDAVVVSRKDRNPKTIYGIKVMAIDELKYENGDIIIVAVKPAYTKDVVKTLIGNGYKKYLFPYE